MFIKSFLDLLSIRIRYQTFYSDRTTSPMVAPGEGKGDIAPTSEDVGPRIIVKSSILGVIVAIQIPF